MTARVLYPWLLLLTGCSLGTLQPLQLPRYVTARAVTAGTLGSELIEVSGMAAATTRRDVLWMINDGGNPATLYAISTDGRTLGRFPVAAPNRDWEDLAGFHWRGADWLAIADIGDNRRARPELAVHLIREPDPGTPTTRPLEPTRTVRFRYADGPRDAESIAFDGERLLILTKESPGADGQGGVGLYALSIDEHAAAVQTLPRLVDLAHTGQDVESRLIRAISGVDTALPTALDIDIENNIAYLLNYRAVREYRRDAGENWTNAFRKPGKRLYTHSLRQAEALTLTADRSLWLTTEARRAPLQVLRLGPLSP